MEYFHGNLESSSSVVRSLLRKSVITSLTIHSNTSEMNCQRVVAIWVGDQEECNQLLEPSSISDVIILLDPVCSLRLA